MFKKMIISWVLPKVFEALLSALQGLSKKTDNTIDDALVKALVENEVNIMAEIKASL